MKRRLPAFLLALFLMLPMVCFPAAATPAPNADVLFTAQDVPTAIAQAEARFSIRITDRTDKGITLSTLEHLQEALNWISFDLFQEAADILHDKYGITVEFIFSSYANQSYAGLTTLSLSSRPQGSYCTIELVQNPSRFLNSGTDTDVMVHELVHLLHYVSEYIWDSTELKDQFYALNGAVPYYADLQDTGMPWAVYLSRLGSARSRCFASDYGAASYYEDAATLLQAVSVNPSRWESLLLDSDGQILLDKYRALTGLLTGHLTAAAGSPLLQLLPDDWAVSGWLEARSLGLVPQALDAAYTGAATRADFCRLITALMAAVWGEEPAARLTAQGYDLSTPFVDTDSDDVAVLYALGIINGKSATVFAPEDNITRQEAAKMLALTAQALGGTLDGSAAAFRDADQFAPWAAEYIAQLSAAGVMNGTGDGKFSPSGTYTRQQAFLTSLRLYHLLEAA